MEKDLTFIFDIDGTICPIKKSDEKYEDLIPNAAIVEKIKEYHNNGAKIVLYTSRNMNTFNGNIGMINKVTSQILYKWLDKWNIPYDEIVFGKLWPGKNGYYVDDRTITPKKFLEGNLQDYKDFCEKGRTK